MKQTKTPLEVISKSVGWLRRWVCYCLLIVLSFSLAVIVSVNQAYSAETSGGTLYAVSPIRQQMLLTQPSAIVTGGRGFMLPQTVVAKDSSGKPLAGVAVTFEVSSNDIVTAIMRGINNRIITVTTDANGMASAANTYSGYIGEGYQVYSKYSGTIQNLQVKASVPGWNAVTFNVEVGTYNASMVDNTPPMISVGAKDDTGTSYIAGTWTNHSVTVSYSATDSLSAIKSCTPEQVFSSEGANQKSAGTAVDIANNSSSVEFGPICIDKTPPVTEISVAQPEFGSWNDDTVTVSLESTDSVSGVGAIYYKLGSGEAVRIDGNSAAVNIDKEGINEMSYWAVDYAGNAEAAGKVNVNIDRSVPTITSSLTPGKNEYGWNNCNVTVNLSATDLYSGIKEIHYKIGEAGTEQTVSGDSASFYINSEGIKSISYWAVDNVGKTSPVETTQVKIDQSNPVVIPPANITVEATAVKTPLQIGNARVIDVGDVELSNDAPVDGFPVGATTITWKAIDAVGNITEAVQTVTVNDTTKPVLTVQGDVVAEATGVGTKVTLPPAKATDIFGVTVTNDAPEVFPVGETLVTWTAVDANKNSVSAQEKVIVVDSIKPVLTVPEKITVEATGIRTHVDIGAAVATDIFHVDVTSNAPLDFPVGKAVVTWTATDANGNVSTGDQEIIVQDTTKPSMVIPEDITIEATDRNMKINIGEAEATDIFSVTVTSNAPQYYQVGTTPVVWQATDANGNYITEIQNVTVTDHTKPLITAPVDKIVEATGRMTPVQIGEPEVYDIFDTDVSSNALPGNLYPIGNTIITWTVSDVNGNSASDDQNILVRDTTKPLLTVPRDVKVEATGIRTPVSIGQATASDIFNVTVKSDAPADYPIGTTKVTWTATDENGNVTLGYQNVTVEDTTKPVLTAPADKRVEATGIRTPVTIGTATAKDIFAVDIKNDAPLDYPIGNTPVTWTATDANNNSDSRIQNITIVDTTKPLLIVPLDVTVEATEPLTPVTLGEPEVSDIFHVTVKNDALTAYPVGITKVKWTATDDNGNISEGVQNVIVKDTIKPVLTVPADITVEATGIRTPVTLEQATATDIFDVDITNNAPVDFPIGTTVVTWTATDKNGNTTIDTQNVKVVDTTEPVVTAPEDIVVEATGILTPVQLGEATGSDIFPVTMKNNGIGYYPLGSTPVTWTGTDDNGNSASVIQTITVIDTTAPVISVPENITLEAIDVLTPVDIGEATGSDIFPVTITSDKLEAYPVGTTTVTWTAADLNGNKTTGTQIITIIDTTAPVISVPEDITLEATAVLTPVDIGEATGSDIFPVTITSDKLEAYPVGTTTVTWTAADLNGNKTTGTQIITIIDTTAPVISVPENITLEAIDVLTPVDIGEATGSDIFPVTITSDKLEAYPVGTTTVTWTAADSNGNKTTGTQNITITDTTVPVISVPEDITLEATAVLTPVDIGEATGSDIFPVTVTSDKPEAYPVGTRTVTWTVTDSNGNKVTDTQNITITDTTVPVISVPEDITLEATAVLTPVEIGEATGSDIFPVTVTSDKLDAYPVGTTTVTWTVTDSNGNKVTDTQNITITDTTVPVISVPEDITLEATAVLTPVEIGEATGSDIFPVTVTSDKPEAYPVGTTTVTWTAADSNGNKVTGTQNITITDTTVPIISVPEDITLEATAVLTPVEIGEATGSDIFPVTVTSDRPEGYPVGTTTVTWTVTDSNGNKVTDTQNITITDTTIPIISVPEDITLEATAVLTPVEIGEATGSDIFPVTVTSDKPEAYPVGTTTVTWTVTDSNGNMVTGAQNITITDKTLPVVSAPEDKTLEATAVLTPVEIGEATGSDIFPVTVTSDKPEAYPVGTTTVTWTATDSNGNKATDIQNISITDTIAPVIKVPGGITAEATAERTSLDIGEATATDIFPITITSDKLIDYPVGTTTVTWVATDENKNVSKGEQLITIKDTTSPVLKIPADITVPATGSLTKVDIGLATATDLFLDSISNDSPEQLMFPVGRTAVTWTAKDKYGNTAKAVQYINVIQKIKINSYNGNIRATTNMIEPEIMLENTGSTEMNLSDMKIRYYFTSEGDKSQYYWCDYAEVSGTSGQRNLTSCVAGSIIKEYNGPLSDHYLEIRFSSNAGYLKPGDKVLIKGRFAKIDFSGYTQTNDYSFNPTATYFVETSKITVYSSGILIGGAVPQQ